MTNTDGAWSDILKAQPVPLAPPVPCELEPVHRVLVYSEEWPEDLYGNVSDISSHIAVTALSTSHGIRSSMWEIAPVELCVARGHWTRSACDVYPHLVLAILCLQCRCCFLQSTNSSLRIPHYHTSIFLTCSAGRHIVARVARTGEHQGPEWNT